MSRVNLSELTATATSDDKYRQVRSSQVAELTGLIVDANRQRPVLVITPAGTRSGPRIDPANLPAEVSNDVDIRILSSTAAVLRMSELLPKPLRVYGGAARIYWPRLSLADGPQDHPVILAFEHTDPQEPLTRITAEVTAWRSRAELLPHGGSRLAARQKKVRSLHRDLTTARQTANQAIVRAEAAERQEQLLRTQLEQVQARNAELMAELAAPHPPLFADPVQQLRHDLHLTWLRATPEAERDTQPLRTYAAGPDLIDSMNLELVTRERILLVMVDVLTGAVHTHPGRAAHRQRTNAAGSSTAQIRGDKAIAWRCSLKTNTPAAPRLLWWQLRDGSIELDRVVRHE
ncbi:hypothetical protein ACFV9C_42645 [Kribbella sp. NPDC059898]|uniref:hypothetical protein n=1 Tax=Kribbella sp. NPDC059898 TaxID=3346995 RepID=UPI003654D863